MLSSMRATEPCFHKPRKSTPGILEVYNNYYDSHNCSCTLY